VGTATVATLALAPAFLSNLSVRANVGPGGDALIVGFVLGGSGSARMLVRGVGPGLAQFGVTGAMSAPQLTLAGATGATIATNSGWGNNTTLAATFAQVGAFPFAAGSTDTATVQSLAIGNYTARISSTGTTSGIALAELYDADPGVISARPVNVSARVTVGTGGSILIAGFVVGGTGGEKLLIRGVGPGLTQFGVSGVLANPVLTVVDASGKTLASNAGWANAPTLASTFAQVGAFPFASGSADAAVLVTVSAGAYTAQISSADATTGQALIEIYEVK